MLARLNLPTICGHDLFGGVSITGVPLCRLVRYQSNPELEHELGSHLYRASLVRALGREIGSCYQRIRELLRTRLYRRGILLDPLYRTSASPDQRDQAQDACNRDMQTVFRCRKGMTQADARTFLLAWRLGLEWGVRHFHHGSNEPTLLVPSGNPSFWWVNEEAARRERSLHKFLIAPQNSTIPQDSKHGQLAPLPLRE